MARSPRLNATAAARFWAKVEKSDGCWLWTARVDRHGYGRFRPGGADTNEIQAQRVAWVLANGTIPDGICVLHRCDNRQCVRPDHLFLGTAADNKRDEVAKQRHVRGDRHPNHGRAFAQPEPEQRARGVQNAAARLSGDEVREIRRLYAAGATQVALAERFGTPQTNISRIVRRLAWAHVE